MRMSEATVNATTSPSRSGPNRDHLLAAIRGAGHWRVRFAPHRPAPYPFLRGRDCLGAVAESAVWSFWPSPGEYPVVPAVPSPLQRGLADDCGYEALVDWPVRREWWRFTRGGRFDGLLAFAGDIDPTRAATADISFESAAQTITQIAEFCRQLTRSVRYGARLDLSIDAIGLTGRHLLYSRASTEPLYGSVAAVNDRMRLVRKFEIGMTERDARRLSVDLACQLFRVFGHTAAPAFVREVQDRMFSIWN